MHCQSSHCTAKSQRNYYHRDSWHYCRQRSYYSHTSNDLQFQVCLKICNKLQPTVCWICTLFLWAGFWQILTNYLNLFHLLPFILCSYIRRGESHWWMKGSTPTQISEIIIKLIKDMAAVSFYPLNVEDIQIFLITKSTFFFITFITVSIRLSC